KNPDLARQYLQMMEHFGGLSVTPHIRDLARDGLDGAELAEIIGNNARLENLTGLFTQGYAEYAGFGGAELGPFARLVETLLEQYTRGNPTVARNQLAVGRGRGAGGPWGLFHRPDWLRYYDDFGQPLRGLAGTGFMDPGYVGAEPPSFGINI